MEASLLRIEAKLDRITELMTPVHAHAAWVDELRNVLERWRVLPRLISAPPEVVD